MDKQLSKAAKSIRNEYYRQWRAANPDKVRAKNRRYWEKKAAKAAEETNEQTKNS